MRALPGRFTKGPIAAAERGVYEATTLNNSFVYHSASFETSLWKLDPEMLRLKEEIYASPQQTEG